MTQRIERVEKLAQQVLGETINELKDPRIGFVTVTRVRVSKDLRHARVLVGVLGTPDEQAETMKGLASARPYLRTVLGAEIRMKYLPELVFELDEGASTAQRIQGLLRAIEQEQRD
jgi:ribosome-binding factor A